jgi:hypothetical protein
MSYVRICPIPCFFSSALFCFVLFSFSFTLALPLSPPRLLAVARSARSARDYHLRTAFACVLGTSMVRQTLSAGPL